MPEQEGTSTPAASSSQATTPPTSSSNNRNNRRSQNAPSANSFSSAIEALPTLKMMSNGNQSNGLFVDFQTKLEIYVQSNFQNSHDFVSTVRDLTDPTVEIMKQLPVTDYSSMKLMNFSNDDEKKSYKESLESLTEYELRNFSSRKAIVKANLSKLWGVKIINK